MKMKFNCEICGNEFKISSSNLRYIGYKIYEKSKRECIIEFYFEVYCNNCASMKRFTVSKISNISFNITDVIYETIGRILYGNINVNK